MNRIFFSPGATGGGNPTPPKRKFLRIETNPEIKLIEGAAHKKRDLDSLIIQFHNSFNVFKSSSVDCIDYLHKYVSNKIVEAVANGSLTQLYVDTHPTLGHGKFRKAFQLPPLVGGDVKPLHRIGDEITGMILMKERSYDGSSRDLKVIANFIEYIEHASVKEADHNFADSLITRNMDPTTRDNESPDFASWSHALRQTFSRDGVYNALNKCSSENPEDVRRLAIETTRQLMYAGVPSALEPEFVLQCLRNIEDYLIPLAPSVENSEAKFKSRIDEYLSIFNTAVENNPSLKENAEIRKCFEKARDIAESVLQGEESRFYRFSLEKSIELFGSTGAALLAGALFI